MDPATLGLLPQAGVAGVLVAVIIYLLRQNNADRKQAAEDRRAYREEILNVQTAHAAENARLSENHTKEMKRQGETHSRQMEAVQAEIAGVRSETARTNKLYEDERRARWHAEDVASRAIRERDELLAGKDGS